MVISEVNRFNNMFHCKDDIIHVVLRHDRYFRIEDSSCGEWMCEHCSASIKEHWIIHFIQGTAECELHVLKTKVDSPIIEKLDKKGQDFAAIGGIGQKDDCIIISNERFQNSSPLRRRKLRSILEEAIPAPFHCNPIYLSKYWQCSFDIEEDYKKDKPFELVKKTWIPVFKIIDIAKSLDAEFTSQDTWQVPLLRDPNNWVVEFLKEVEREEEADEITEIDRDDWPHLSW